MAIVGNYVYGIGLAISLIAVIVKQSTYNISVLIIYILVLALMKFGMKKKKLGHILDKTTNEPVPYAIIRVTTLDHTKSLSAPASATQTADITASCQRATTMWT